MINYIKKKEIFLQCISNFQPSSRPSAESTLFSALHDKYFPSSSLLATNDKVLVVVLPSVEVWK